MEKYRKDGGASSVAEFLVDVWDVLDSGVLPHPPGSQASPSNWRNGVVAPQASG